MADQKISGLPADTSLDDNHYVLLNDPTGPTTKRTTLGTLRLFFQGIAAWITGSMIDWSATSMAARVTTDAAGWKVINMGKYKIYTKSVAQATINVGASDRTAFTNVALPTGMTNLNNTIINAIEIRGNGYPGNFFVGVGTPSFGSSTAITGLIGNNYPGGTLATGAYTLDVTLTEYL